MHGNTKEIHRFVRASQPSPLANATPTERVYRDVIDAAAGRHGVRTEVVVDVIAATSAGGINGIFLAKALAHDLSQEGLRDLWFERGDIGGLVRGPHLIPWQVRLPALLPEAVKEAPLHGDKMSLWLWEALEAMDAPGAAAAALPSLMPDGHELELFVTMTDFGGYERHVPIKDPRTVRDRRHRHFFRLAHGSDEDTFGSTYNLALAFAARATSAFPGAFPAISPSSMRADVPDATGPLEDAFFRPHKLSERKPDDAYFVDGGVLDNRPFGLAIGAVRRRPAEGEVDRRLVYLEPDPAHAEPPSDEPPSPPKTVLGSLVGIPRKDPILDDILAVGSLNERVRRVRDVVESSFDEVRGDVTAVVGADLGTGPAPDLSVVAGWQSDIHDRAREYAGHTYETYLRIKVSDAVDALAAAACDACDYPPDSDHAALVRGVYRAWAAGHGLFDLNRHTPVDAPPLQFLKAFDLGYGERRLQFVIAALNWWYKQGGPPRPQLDAVKSRLWDAVILLRTAMSGRSFDAALSAKVRACFPEAGIPRFIRHSGLEPALFLERDGTAERLDDLQEALRVRVGTQLANFGGNLYRDLVTLTADWPADARRDLLVRYLGFPLWDVLLHPVVSSDPVGERDAVEVIRLSPRDTELLDLPDGRTDKLDGIHAAHFSAFFKLSYRQNDYLWGRLDAAERMIGILLGRSDPDFRRLCGEAFLAILEEENDAVTDVDSLVDSVREQAELLAGA
jgi:patatin-related protein